MDNIVPHRDIVAPITVRRVDSHLPHTLTAFGGGPAPEKTRVSLSAKQHIVVIGATLEALRSASDQLRGGSHTGLEHVLFDAGLETAQWTAELDAKLNSVVARSWRVRDLSIVVVGDGFSGEQLDAVLGGLQFIPRTVYLINSGSAREAAAVHPLQQRKFGPMQQFLKRILDIAGGSVLLFFLLPLMLCVALLIRLDSPGPVLFRQKRRGLLGQPFDIFKFRTMMVQENGEKVVQARPQDPRVTRLGRFLRRSSMDELPQLINVVKGEMSLVGPRPHAEAHDRHYSAIVPRYAFRSYVKPGMTGWAQVHGYRGQIKNLDDITKRVEFDGWYARNASVLLDFKILLRTVSIVINQKNAY